MSAPRTPTRSPFARSPTARLAATVDLPTPPLPEATATIAPTPDTTPRAARAAAGAAGWGAVRPRGAACAVSTAVTESTPGSASTAFSAALRSGSNCGPRSRSTSIAKATLPSRMTRPETMPRETMSAPLSGSATRPNASRICRSVTPLISFSPPQRGGTARSFDRGAWFGAPVEADWRSSKPVAGSRENIPSQRPGLQRRRTCGIWDRRPDLTTPAHALYRVAHLAALRRARIAAEAVPRQHGGKVEVDVLAKSGRWPLGQRSAWRRPLGRQSRRWRGAEPSRARPASPRLRGAPAARSGPFPARAAGRLWYRSRDCHRGDRDPRHLVGDRILPRSTGRGRGRAAVWGLQSDDPARPQLSSSEPDREGADAECDPRQPNRDRLSQRGRSNDPRAGNPSGAGRGIDADRRREHRRHQLRRILDNQRRAVVSLQYPGAGRDRQIRCRERDARGGGRAPDRAGCFGR